MREILTTDRLLLREIEPADLAALSRIYGDAECMRYYPATKTADETGAWYQELAFDSYAANGFGLWAVVDRSTGTLLGDCGITLQATPEGQEPEIGYHIWRDFWGRGYATEAAAGCRDHALTALGRSRVVSITSPENGPSQRVAAKVHQRREVFSKTSKATGQTIERYLYITEAARPGGVITT